MSRRSRRGMASLPCGLTHGREDGPPGGKGQRGFETGRPPEAAKPRLTWTNLEPHVSHL